MSKALVLGAAALALSVGAASAQVGYPGYDYGGATVPLYGYATSCSPSAGDNRAVSTVTREGTAFRQRSASLISYWRSGCRQ